MDMPDIFAIDFDERLLLLEDGSSIEISFFVDAEGDQTEDEEEWFAAIAQHEDHWLTVCLDVFKERVLH